MSNLERYTIISTKLWFCIRIPHFSSFKENLETLKPIFKKKKEMKKTVKEGKKYKKKEKKHSF